MRPKTVMILAGATIIAIGGAAAALNVERNYRPQSASGEIFPGLIDKLDQVAKIEVQHKDGTFTLVRGDKGFWTVPGSDNYPANQAQAQKIILQMAGIKFFEAKTAKKDLYTRLHLEDVAETDSQARRARLSDSGGKSLGEIVVGKKRYDLPGALREGAYVRIPGNAQTWLARGEIDVPTDLNAWLRKLILNIDEDDVAEIEIRHPDGEVVKITKPDPKARHFTLHGVPKGKRVKYESDPDNIANVVEDLNLSNVVRADKIDFAADKTVSATYTSRSGLVADIWLTRQDDKDWLKVKLTARPDAPAPQKDAEPAAKIAERVTQWTTGWAYEVPGFKAERLRRRMADMAVDDEEGS